MTKKHFIALADMIKEYQENPDFNGHWFSGMQLDLLADFCKAVNPRFNRERWVGYINGECGKNGGKVKTEVSK